MNDLLAADVFANAAERVDHALAQCHALEAALNVETVRPLRYALLNARAGLMAPPIAACDSRVNRSSASRVNVSRETISMMPRPDWHRLAACRGQTALFYPPLGGETYIERRQREAAAKLICAGCDVKASCDAEADKFGIWAGKEPNERR